MVSCDTILPAGKGIEALDSRQNWFRLGGSSTARLINTEVLRAASTSSAERTMSSGHPAHFRVSIVPIRAREGRRADTIVRRYIKRHLSRHLRPDVNALGTVRDYQTRKRTADAKDEVLFYTFRDRGSGMTADQLYEAVDRGRRRKDGRYKRHAGKMPRLGLFVELSIPRDLSLGRSEACVEKFLDFVGETYGIAGEAVIHRKGRGPDHAHCVLTDVHVGPEGVGGKVRQLNGLSQKLSGNAIVDDGRVLAPAAELMRACWATILTEATGVQFDHRSYLRRGLDITPLTVFSKAEIDRQRQLGDETWRDQREEEKRLRHELAAEKAERALARDLANQPPTVESNHLESATDPYAGLPDAVDFPVAIDKTRLEEAKRRIDLFGQQFDRIAARHAGRSGRGQMHGPPMIGVGAPQRPSLNRLKTRTSLSQPITPARWRLVPPEPFLKDRFSSVRPTELGTAINLASGLILILMAIVVKTTRGIRSGQRGPAAALCLASMMKDRSAAKRLLLIMAAKRGVGSAQVPAGRTADEQGYDAALIAPKSSPHGNVGRLKGSAADKTPSRDIPVIKVLAEGEELGVKMNGRARQPDIPSAMDAAGEPAKIEPREWHLEDRAAPSSSGRLKELEGAPPLSTSQASGQAKTLRPEGGTLSKRHPAPPGVGAVELLPGSSRTVDDMPPETDPRVQIDSARSERPIPPKIETTLPSPTPLMRSGKSSARILDRAPIEQKGEPRSCSGFHGDGYELSMPPKMPRPAEPIADTSAATAPICQPQPVAGEKMSSRAGEAEGHEPDLAPNTSPNGLRSPDHPMLRTTVRGRTPVRFQDGVSERSPAAQPDREAAKQTRRLRAKERRLVIQAAIGWFNQHAWTATASVECAKLLGLQREQFDKAVLVVREKPHFASSKIKPTDLIQQAEAALRDMSCFELLAALNENRLRYQARKRSRSVIKRGPETGRDR